jgi:uncharacterized protein (TIGR02996 family)
MSLFDDLKQLVRGKPAAASPPKPAEIVQFTVKVAETPPTERDEKRMLEAIQSGSETGRAIYADWLEEHGRAQEAEYVRAELAVRDCEPLEKGKPRDEALGAATRRFRNAARRVDADFRAYMSRPTLEKCVRFELKCPKQWSELALTDNPRVRNCGVCRQQVRFCDEVQEARALAMKGQCVAVELTRPRMVNDLEPPIAMTVAGRMSTR